MNTPAPPCPAPRPRGSASVRASRASARGNTRQNTKSHHSTARSRYTPLITQTTQNKNKNKNKNQLVPKPQTTDPADELIHAIVSARQSLNRIDGAIKQRFTDPTTNEPTLDQTGADELFTTPLGRQLTDKQLETRMQLALFAKQYIGLGIEERKQQAIESWANLFMPIIRAMFEDPDLNLTTRQLKTLPMVVERHVHLLEAAESGQ